MRSAGIRDELIRTLRLDLIGPEPGGPREREELPHEPSRWYVGGFLVPFEAPEEQKVDPTGQEELFAAGEENGADDADVPERASTRKVFLPSSVGLSVLVGSSAASLEAEVTWGDYRLPGAEGEEGVAARSGEATWKREPRRATVTLALPEGEARPATVPVPESGGLKLVVTARAAGGAEALGPLAGEARRGEGRGRGREAPARAPPRPLGQRRLLRPGAERHLPARPRLGRPRPTASRYSASTPVARR